MVASAAISRCHGGTLTLDLRREILEILVGWTVQAIVIALTERRLEFLARVFHQGPRIMCAESMTACRQAIHIPHRIKNRGRREPD